MNVRRRLGRLSATILSILAIAACERAGKNVASTTDAPRFEVLISDELRGLAPTVTGVEFWTHPTIAFNSLMVVAASNGVTSYNIEDGNEVSTIAGVDARGVGVSYVGRGPDARGFIAYFDAGANAFKIHEINNVTRAFMAVDGEIPVRGGVRGFCFGRARDIDTPSLYMLQKGSITQFDFRIEDGALRAKQNIANRLPIDLRSCAVDGENGAVIIADAKGGLYRLGDESEAQLIARAGVESAGDLNILIGRKGDSDNTTGQIALVDPQTGVLHLFERDGSAALGVVTAAATDESDAVGRASAFGAIRFNLGGLYRDGALAFATAISEEESIIRIIPMNGLDNALGLDDIEPGAPRGTAPVEDNSGLLIETGYQPD